MRRDDEGRETGRPPSSRPPSTILVVGAGAIGNELVKNLALLGVDRLLVFDRDRVERDNLSKSVLFRAPDVGALKAEAAARAALDLNPAIHVGWRAGDVETDLGLGVLRRVDVVVAGLDNRLARIALNRLCRRAGVPWIDAGIGALNGQVAVFEGSRGPCYECSLGPDDYEQILVPCNRLASRYAEQGRVATTPAIAAIVAGVQAQEALKLLDPETWRGRSLAGRELVYNGASASASVIGLPVRSDCPAHWTLGADAVVALPNARAATATALDLIAASGVGAPAEMRLNVELAVSARCRGCGRERAVLRPLRSLFAEDFQCDRCGADEYVETTHAIDAASALAGRPLADLGVPALDVLEVRGPAGASTFLELAGDACDLLGFSPGAAP